MATWKIVTLSIVGVLVILAVVGQFIPDDDKSNDPQSKSSGPFSTTATSRSSATTEASTTGSSSATNAVTHPVKSSTSSSVTSTSASTATKVGLTTAELRAQMINDYGPELAKDTLRYVKSIHQVAGAPWVETTLYPDSDAGSPARLMCVAIQQYYSEHADKRKQDDPSGLSIRASTGDRIIFLLDYRDPCKVDL